MDSYEIKSELDNLMHFLPVNYLINTVIPATNNKGGRMPDELIWTDGTLHFLGLLLAMQVYEII